MEFNEKLQHLRRQKGITQEELAGKLYVSRTAISKWESGRGYPNIESLKAIAEFFCISVDELLSSDEVLDIARKESVQKAKQYISVTFGLLDVCMALLFFLPFFASRTDGVILETSLLALTGVEPWLRTTYFVLLSATVFYGVVTLALQNCQACAWVKIKTVVSIVLSVATAALFIMSLQPYAAIFALVLLAIKTILLIKRR